MPGAIDGIDLAEEVHRHWPNVHLLVTSGDVDVVEDDLPDDSKFVPKPYRASTLIEKVRRLIEQDDFSDESGDMDLRSVNPRR